MAKTNTNDTQKGVGLHARRIIAYAVMVEKYVQSTAEQAAMIRLLNIPYQIGSVPCTRLFQFVSKWVLGIAVNPDCNSPFDLVALINIM